MQMDGVGSNIGNSMHVCRTVKIIFDICLMNFEVTDHKREN